MVRRTLLVATMLVCFWTGPAAADSYGDVLDTGRNRGGAVTAGAPGVSSARGDLARTGQDNVVPLAQGAVALVGGGMLLVLVGRRRRTSRAAA